MYAYCDCMSGVSGDMFLAALCHLGLDLAPLQKNLTKAGIDCQFKAWQENREAGPGFRVDVSWPKAQPLRHPKDIADIFHKVDVSDNVRKNALAVLNALTIAEAHAHQIKPEEVHFHEVGAIDTLFDILGAAWGLEQMGIDHIICSPLPWFSGTVECEHGILPLPAPATAYLLMQKPIRQTNATTELVTPTGAALVHGLCSRFENAPHGTLMRMGTGYGSRKAPSGLRIYLVEGECKKHENMAENIAQLESHVDHLTAEEIGAAINTLSSLSEVLDVLWLNGIGKKNRPAGLLRVLCKPNHLAKVRAAFFTHTHTLGIRESTLTRHILPRKTGEVNMDGEAIIAKEYKLDGQTWFRPESDALITKAQKMGVGVPALRIKK